MPRLQTGCLQTVITVAYELGCPQLGWISLTTLQEVDIYQQMTVVTLVF